MISGTRINPLTDQFVKKFHKIMREKGFKMTSQRESAMVNWSYKKESSKSICISAWHGNGKYGNLKLVLGLLETEAGGWSPKEVYDYCVTDYVTADESLTEEGFKEYQTLLANIEKYLKEVK